MSLQAFQWLRDFCASYSHFWAESPYCVSGWRFAPKGRGEQGASSPESCPSSTASTHPQGHPNWSSCSAVMASESQGARAIIAQIVCSAPFWEPAQLSRADQGDRANQGRNNLCCSNQLNPSPHQPIPSKLGSSLFHTWRKGSLEEFPRAEPVKAQPLGAMCQLQEW